MNNCEINYTTNLDYFNMNQSAVHKRGNLACNNHQTNNRNQEHRDLDETGAPFLLDFLLDVVKEVIIKEFSEGNSQPIAELLQRNHAGILTLGIEHAVNGGGSYPGTAGKGIDGDASFVAQSQNPGCDSFFRIHITSSFYTIYR